MKVSQLRATVSHRESLTQATAAGFGTGIVALGFGDLSSNLLQKAPPILVAIFVTCVLVAGFAIAQTWAHLHHASRRLALSDPRNSQVEDPDVPDLQDARARIKSKEANHLDWAVTEMSGSKGWWWWMLGLVLMSGVLYLLSIWAGALEQCR